MTTAAEIKKLFAAVEIAEAAYDAADEAVSAEDWTEAHEAAWNEAYRVLWSAEQAFAEAIEDFTVGAIDAKTARRMLIVKRAELAGLVHRLAA